MVVVATTGGTAALEGGSVGRVVNHRSQGSRRSGLELSGEEAGTGRAAGLQDAPQLGFSSSLKACDFFTHRWCPFPSRKKPILVQGLPHSCFLQGCLRTPSTSSLSFPALSNCDRNNYRIFPACPGSVCSSVGAPVSSSSSNCLLDLA